MPKIPTNNIFLHLWVNFMDLLITLKYWIFFFLMSYQEKFQPVKCYLSRIRTSRKTEPKKLSKFSFLVFSTDFFLSFALNTYVTLNMFLLSIQTNFYIILSLYVEGLMKKNSSLSFILSVCFQASKIWMFFGKIYYRASFEINFSQK